MEDPGPGHSEDEMIWLRTLRDGLVVNACHADTNSIPSVHVKKMSV